MKSKSFDLRKSPSENGKANKTFDFVGLYKSAAETNVKLLSKPKTVENLDKENNFGTPVNTASKKLEGSANKKKKKGKNEPLDISHINSDEHGPHAVTTKKIPSADSHATSTPYASRKTVLDPSVKSIMKNSVTAADDTMASSASETPISKPKKRNKSVSFMLEDTEEIATKKTKSEESVPVSEKVKAKKKHDEKKKLKKHKKKHTEKENEVIDSMETEQTAEMPEKKSKSKKLNIPEAAGDSSNNPVVTPEKKKKPKKVKKQKEEESSEANENDSNNNEEVTEQKTKKYKKKKRSKSKSFEPSEGEPACKVKKDIKPEVIAEDLENLRIGDNPHTLTNLLDEMTVVDKDKKKKNKLRRKKDTGNKQSSVSSSETADLEKIEEGKEKIKWKKRKWNKEKKGDVNEDLLATSVLIENLPLKIMCSYKKLLADHFGKLGLIKRIGIAELYPTEDPKPVFTTTINFYSDGAASKALEEDNTLFEGSRIRVKRLLPPTETTVVVRSYAELTEQSLSSVFTSAGRIRSIRHSVKGKKSMATAFIEFDGSEAVERAIKMAEDAKIGGKKIHASKFELRASRRKEIKKKNVDSENEGDSEDSNE
ncbi:hypothetical protein O0L34_g12810 [Tuta absoluta]|nr:hypothetical protein O0L34_g12810 [Tuta absoluta]